jgi:parallel beta-helix repeat protein
LASLDRIRVLDTRIEATVVRAAARKRRSDPMVRIRFAVRRSRPRWATSRRRPDQRLAAAALALAASGLLTLGVNPALATSQSCGTTITRTTTLHADLINCPGDGLVIAANNITLNLNGHRIDGDALPGVAARDAGIRLAGHHGVTIENGTVVEFDLGVFLDAAGQNTLRRLTAVRNAPRGIDLENHSDNNRIQDNISTNNVRNGIVMITSDYNLLRDNTTRDDPHGGIIGLTASHNRIEHNTSPVAVLDGSNDNLIAGNAATGGEAGILAQGNRNVLSRNSVYSDCDDILVAGDNNAVVSNVVRDALEGCGAGIAVEGGVANLVAHNSVARTADQGIRVNAYEEFGGIPTIGTVIRANLVRDAASDGIAIATDSGSGETVNDTVVEANLIIRSGNDGIKIARAATTLTRNLALHNANLGIEAMPGVTDGGGNHAYGNGTPLQCINITC